MAKRTIRPAEAPERPQLTERRARAVEQIQTQLDEGKKVLELANTAQSPDAYMERNQPWHDYTRELLRKLFTTDALAEEFTGPFGFSSCWDSRPRVYVGNLARRTEASLLALKSILGRINLIDEGPGVAGTVTPSAPVSPVLPPTREVFVVHGRDEATKHTVARFLERLSLIPIILHEQPDKGRTLIEKFEDHSAAGFALMLLTPDDEGRLLGSADLKLRARQNVIFELGFFIGRLGRNRVCALKADGVEEPSDLRGVLYVPLDSAGAWKLILARELRAAGIDVDMNRAL